MPRKRIGIVSHTQISTDSPPCNRHAKPNAGTLDVALVKINSGVSVTLVPKVTVAPLADVDQDDPVKFAGWKSGAVNNVRVAAATIWKTVSFNPPVCFGDLIMLDSRTPTYVVSPVCQVGDSGSWIVEDSFLRPTIPAWYGTLIAGDRQQSYACFAEHVFDWANRQHPLRLP
jgi:hypothetical protein